MKIKYFCIKKTVKNLSVCFLLAMLALPMGVFAAETDDGLISTMSSLGGSIENKIYTLEELEDAKNRLLAFASYFKIKTAYVDENLNAVVICLFQNKMGSENAHKLHDIAEMKKIYIKIISDDTNLTQEKNENDKNRQLRIDGGRILKNKKILDVDFVGLYEDKLIVPIINMTEKKKQAVIRLAGKSSDSLQFVPRSKLTYDFNSQYPMMIKADDPYIYYYDLLIELKHKPFMQEDRLMLPIRDIYDTLDAISELHYQVHWLGTEEELAMLNYKYIHLVRLSVKNNELICTSHKGAEMVSLEGKAVIQDGTLYVPYTFENTIDILHTNPTRREGGWNSETKTLEFYF